MPKDRVTIRKGQAADVDGLLALLKLLFAIEADFSFNAEQQRRGLMLLLEQETGCCLFAAELDGKLIGMCSAQLLVSTAEGALKAIVEDLVVAENYQGMGIGRKLLSAAEKWAKDLGVRRLDLLADCHNRPALDFYRRLNWARTDLIALQKKL